jgi:isopenicillin N synthase-like dioxygenase
MMQIYTNGTYAAAMHRVVLPSTAKRLSAGFFTFPNMDATIAPLPAMITKDRPQQYEATTPRQFISRKFEAVGGSRSK